jgi:hypothetical protein
MLSKVYETSAEKYGQNFDRIAHIFTWASIEVCSKNLETVQ